MAKSKYEKWLLPENLILLEGWARDGLTDEQIAQNMGICRDTLIEWKKKYSDISHSFAYFCCHRIYGMEKWTNIL